MPAYWQTSTLKKLNFILGRLAMNFLKDLKRYDELYEKIITQKELAWLSNFDKSQIAELVQPLKGTTIMAIKAKDAVVMAGDTRASTPGEIVSDKVDKILEIDKRTLVAFAGVMGWGMKFIRAFKQELRIYRKSYREPKTKGKVRKLAERTGQFLAPAIQLNMIVVPILGIFDPNKGPLVFQIKCDQSYIEKNWVTEGSGGADARGVLTDRYRENLSEEEAIAIANRAINAAITDPFTGPKRTIKVINKNGIDIIEGV